MPDPVIAILSQGAMGAGVGARLHANGVRVLTCVEGRSAASAARAAKAGMEAVPEAGLAEADAFLSILPPDQAMATAERLAPIFAAAPKPPLYVDCNAISPETMTRLATLVEGHGLRVADAGIIGGPPREGYAGPFLYASGSEAPRLVTLLSGRGIDLRVIDGPIGAASALKMSYAGITKGLVAIGSAMMLAATRAGAAEALHAELAASQPALAAWFGRMVPSMYDKAYRWAGEMEEIADFTKADDAAPGIYRGARALYERLADPRGAEDVAALKAFLSRG
ncbi:NAD(P)-dependent oxidoreductase [Roseomonas terrae]|jgi:putative dehydrogenase|uniref:NAD(P)-dependent oxidoreductase n=1 Tax=Neoroseomonas terrae TaxID=424799 RepID=A0ABS5EPK4_9PROT|nr:NAD(P)-dependent oxidoreductase [Neoroseomonas terrae]MBR0652950.1 NAD(P)-dependent oxidoreductase [Neoroseomonas terrae]